MDLKFDNEKNVLYCNFSGRLIAENSALYKDTLEKEIYRISREKNIKKDLRIVFDLLNVEYLSSAFLRVCFFVAKKIQAYGLSIINTNQFVKDLLITSGMENIAKVSLASQEEKKYFPPKEFVNASYIKSFDSYKKMYDDSVRDPEGFWKKQGEEHICWFKKFEKTLDWEPPYSKWFIGGKLNASYNCLDRHLDTDLSNKAALIWEGEPASPNKPGEERIYTYRQLHYEVCLFANVLKQQGIKKGDRVIIYMPLTPESIIAMLSCARIGAIHSVIFGGFSAQSIAERIKDSQARLIITADGGFRRGGLIQLKRNVDEALRLKDDAGQIIASTIEKVIIHRRAFNSISFQEGRDLWWHQQMDYAGKDCPAEHLDSTLHLKSYNKKQFF